MKKEPSAAYLEMCMHVAERDYNKEDFETLTPAFQLMKRLSADKEWFFLVDIVKGDRNIIIFNWASVKNPKEAARYDICGIYVNHDAKKMSIHVEYSSINRLDQETIDTSESFTSDTLEKIDLATWRKVTPVVTLQQFLIKETKDSPNLKQEQKFSATQIPSSAALSARQVEAKDLAQAIENY
jgi:hypothetical protein